PCGPLTTTASTSPEAMASRVSRTSSGVGLVGSSSVIEVPDRGRRRRSNLGRTPSYVECHQGAIGVRKVADDAFHGLRELPDQRWDRQDLVGLGELGPLRQVDDLDLVVPLQALVAEFTQVREGGARSRRVAGDVETQVPFAGA